MAAICVAKNDQKFYYRLYILPCTLFLFFLLSLSLSFSFSLSLSLSLYIYIYIYIYIYTCITTVVITWKTNSLIPTLLCWKATSIFIHMFIYKHRNAASIYIYIYMCICTHTYTHECHSINWGIFRKKTK